MVGMTIKYMKKNIKKPELLAPAGNLEKMKTAFAFGADAVYLGIPDFSLRARINDFDLDAIAEAVKYAHKLKKKVYITLNIFAHNHHLDKLPSHLKQIKLINPDGLIISDPGIFSLVKKSWPEIKLILSTQANCTNWLSAQFWKDQGAKRIILGRETTIDEIIEMKKKVKGVEIETFIHGAMCMSYSGRCFLSKYLSGRSANLGDCSQPCRWSYQLELDEETPIINMKPEGREQLLTIEEDEKGSYIMNSQDMCLIEHVPELIEAGLNSFKIEGRAKSVYYLAVVINAYRQAIDAYVSGDKNLKKKLRDFKKEMEEKLVHRGYTDGFIFGQGQMAQAMEQSHLLCDWEFCGQVIEGEINLKAGKEKLNLIKVHNSLKVGDELEIVRPGLPILKYAVSKIFDHETGEPLESAHGGQAKTVVLPAKDQWPIRSVLRRRK
jgi:putative protease